MQSKLINLLVYIVDRSKEASTWSGIAFLVGASTSHFALLMSPGECALIGGLASGILKILLPDAGAQKND